MGRLPFNADGVNPPKRAAKNAEALSVSQLASMIDAALRQAAPATIRVRGEISGFRDRTHWYFDLKDANAVIGGVVFASVARKSAYQPENGREVIASGRLEFYAPGGRVSFVITKLEPVGVGSLEEAFRALVRELRDLGWFEAERKRPLPVFPRRIAVVTSRAGAALQDVLDTMRRRCPAVGVVLLDARVQGPEAAREVTRAVRWASGNASRLGVDAILVTRGGGSMEDLWTFNEREVCRAILESTVPVVGAIGHETDTTIAELVADVRAATPTQAAMLLTPDREAIEEEFASRRAALESTMRRGLQRLARELDFADESVRNRWLGAAARRRGVLDRAQLRLSQRRPDSVAVREAERMRAGITRVGVSLGHAMREKLRAARDAVDRSRLVRVGSRIAPLRRERLAGMVRELEAIGPQSILDRGYSITQRADGAPVRSASDVTPGDRIQTRLADGVVRSVVDDADGSVRPRLPAKRARRSRDASDQLDLFERG